MKQLFIIGLISLVVAGCSKQNAETPDNAKPVVYAVNYPLAYFAERIAGDRMETVFPEIDGDPAFWKPTPEEVGAFQDADHILLNGASYAKWVPKVSLPQSRLINTSESFRDDFIALDNTPNHVHGPEGAHAHGDLAFTTWLDPQLAIRQAAAIRDVLGGDENFHLLEKDLSALDSGFEQAFARLGQQPLLGSHPVYQYLSRAYGLNLKSVHWEPDALPDAQMWRELDEILKSHPAKIMLWEAEPLPQAKDKLSEKGIQSIVFDPCGNRPASGDFLSTMNDNLRNLE